MKNIKRNIISIGLFVFIGSVLISCNNDMEEVKSFVNTEKLPELYAENIEILRMDSGKIVVKVTAPVLERFSKEKPPYDLFKKGLIAISYKNYPIQDSYIYCKYAKCNTEKNIWEARNDVVVVSSEGDTLRTEQMFWDMNTGEIYSDKSVQITNDKEIVYGVGFEANQKSDHFKAKHIKGIFNIEE